MNKGNKNNENINTKTQSDKSMELCPEFIEGHKAGKNKKTLCLSALVVYFHGSELLHIKNIVL